MREYLFFCLFCSSSLVFGHDVAWVLIVLLWGMPHWSVFSIGWVDVKAVALNTKTFAQLCESKFFSPLRVLNGIGIFTKTCSGKLQKTTASKFYSLWHRMVGKNSWGLPINIVALLLLITVNKRSLHSPLFEENNENVSDELEYWHWEILILQYLIKLWVYWFCEPPEKSKLNLLNCTGCGISIYKKFEVYGHLHCF